MIRRKNHSEGDHRKKKNMGNEGGGFLLPAPVPSMRKNYRRTGIGLS